MVYDPATGTFVPGPAGVAPAPAYPYAPAPGYAPPPGYPYPTPAGYPAAPQNDFADMGPKRAGKKKKYKRGSGKGLVVAVLLLLFVGVVGSGAWVVLTENPVKDRLIALLGGTKTAPSDPDGGGTPAAVAKPTGNPRRLLAISVTKYLYCNPLIGGKNKNDASEFGEAVKSLAFRWEIPDGKENNQLFVITDADGKLPPAAARLPMLKPVIADTLKQFCDTSRSQDRVVIYFGGHAVAKGGKGFLIPTEGDPNEPDTLLPLDDVWAAVKACPSQQKVVLFDVCRLSTDDNAVRPGSEPMTEELEKLLHSAPTGVQVVTSCSAGQTAGEFRTAPDADTPQGSAFLGALRVAARKGKGGKVAPADPFPVALWVDGAEKRLADALGKDRPSKPKLSGGEGAAVEVTAGEPARRFDYPSPPKGADAKEVKAAFALLDVPPLLGEAGPADSLDEVVVFPAEAMVKFAPTAADNKPWRTAATKALADLRAKWAAFADPKKESVLKDGLSGKANDELKKAIEREQKPLSILSLELDELVESLAALQPQAEKDESAYWRATFRFALAQSKLRLAFSHEANLALGNVRTDSLPDGVERGVRLVQVPKMKNKKESAGAKDGQALLEELAKEAKGTPWEVAAKQWRGVSLGLEWRVKKADADTTAADEKK
jgi:hypothetical protein